MSSRRRVSTGFLLMKERCHIIHDLVTTNKIQITTNDLAIQNNKTIHITLWLKNRLHSTLHMVIN